jgi:formylglycine-generating enzyme required for sulfatase activity
LGVFFPIINPKQTNKMKKNMISLCALLLIGAASMMTAGAQTPTLAVFVVGGDNTLVTPLTTALRANLTFGGRYTLTSVDVSGKLTELQSIYTAGGSINRDALAAWGHSNGISAICLVVNDVKGSDHLFSAQLIDAKDSKLEGRGSYIRTGVAAGDVSRVAVALSQQLAGQGRTAAASARSYPAELDIEMVRVVGGVFTMGCNGTTDGSCYADDGRETPTRIVQMSSFSIGKYEITQAQWKAVMKGHPLENTFYWGGVGGCGTVPCDDQRPMENMSLDMIDTAFLPRLRALTGKNYRLPTNAEWEYAARGCKGDGGAEVATCDPYKYSGSNTIEEIAWSSATSGGTTHPVGQKKPNGLGIYDMCGNVWELCLDCWDANYYSSLTNGVVNPQKTDCAVGYLRVFRGSSLYEDASIWPRVAARSAASPSHGYEHIGFRVVLP